MQILSVILYILLFILCLSVLVIVHELGHFATAKFFKVYVLEYSIGFGPALIHKKRKNGETYFSLRAIPFGGYVSLFDKGVELPQGIEVDESRRFSNIKKWKRIIILFAGVFNNAILALLLFFISESACMQKAMFLIPYNNDSHTYYSYVEVKQNSPASEKGIVNKDQIDFLSIKKNDGTYLQATFALDKEALLTYNDDSNKKVAAVLLTNQATFVTRDYYSLLHFFPYGSESEYESIDFNNEINASDSNIKNISLNITMSHNETKANYNFIVTPTLSSDNTMKFSDTGLSFFLLEYYNDIPTAFQNTFKDFGTSSTQIYRSLAGLFTNVENWQNVGGIISIGVQTSNILANMGIGKFLYVWGLISVNLAIINLLPFPGLDGWQILVLLVEMIFRKNIPDKVKNGFSLVGMLLLFTLMIVIIIKDVIGLI